MAKRAQIEAVRPVLTALDQEVATVENVLDAVEAGADKATEVLETGLEKVADVVPEALDKSVHISAEVARKGAQALRDPRKVLIALSIAGAVTGAALGVVAYKLMKKRLEREFEERLEHELDEMREHYLRSSKTGQYVTPRTAAEALLAKDAVEALETYTGEAVQQLKSGKDDEPAETDAEEVVDEGPKGLMSPAGKVDYTRPMNSVEARETIREQVVTVEQKPGPDVRNIFIDGRPIVDEEWDLEAEEAKRDPAVPYVISHDEYMENTFAHPQSTFSYYSGDDVLANPDDVMVHDVEAVVGSENLSKFGHGSRDPKIVYVRNERLEMDIEVVCRDDKYSETVMNLRHSSETPGLRKARWGDHE